MMTEDLQSQIDQIKSDQRALNAAHGQVISRLGAKIGMLEDEVLRLHRMVYGKYPHTNLFAYDDGLRDHPNLNPLRYQATLHKTVIAVADSISEICEAVVQYIDLHGLTEFEYGDIELGLVEDELVEDEAV